ncbi:MAG TPA: fructose-bisphosphate aldolase class I [Chloroflexi bacterium]|jgi:fructose-bisphosphate aldolase class I|nr:fructose-bisphosphate aldolase class I [Chloroflexota bacterium]
MTDLDLITTAQELVAERKGILAADESTGTITRRFSAVGVESTPETRRDYRQMLFTTPRIETFLSGVILYDETIRQSTTDGVLLRDVLVGKGIIPGIKVDMGTTELANFPGEVVTEGLDGLRERLAEYRDMGARFCKWRAVIRIGDGTPTRGNLVANAHAMARYAALCQEMGLMPIVEPEVLMDGDHTLERCERVTTATLHHTFEQLFEQRVLLEGMLLKPNMVVPGKGSLEDMDPTAVAEATLRTLQRTVPAAVPGVVFLSGGQTPEQATMNLNAMNQMGEAPWELTFSFARALQGPAMEAWSGKAENVQIAQELFYQRAQLASAAREGEYSETMERATTRLSG